MTEAEQELGRCGALLGEVVDGRKNGDRSDVNGHSDDDLLGAIEELEIAIKTWRFDQRMGLKFG